MTRRLKDPLLLVGKAIAIVMQAAMVLGAIALIVAAVGITFFTPELAAEADMEFFPADFPVAALVGVMLIGLAIVTMLFFFFDKLRRIIGTVGEGDPFQPANAVRLNRMAWLMIGIQLSLLPATALGMKLAEHADEMNEAQITVGRGLDLEGILLAIVLFILARVFRHGAAMRDDLEGTV